MEHHSILRHFGRLRSLTAANRRFLPAADRTFVCCVASSIIACLAIGCDRPATIQLPNGYKWQRNSNVTHVILGPPEAALPVSNIVGPDVFRLGVVDGRVLGEIRESPDSELPSPNRPGFFILDTKQHYIMDGLTTDEFDYECAQLGITEPSMRKVAS